MAKIDRKTFVQFGNAGTSTFFGQFGSKEAGTPQTSKNPDIIQQLAAWQNGWQDAITNSDKVMYYQDMNGFSFVLSYMIAYLMQMGIPEWDAGTTYFTNSIVQDADGNGQWFKSLQDNNVNNTPPESASNAFWEWINAPQVPIGVMVDFVGITAPFGYLLADGSDVSRTTYANLFSKITMTLAGTYNSGSAVVSGLSSTTNIKAGYYVSGTGIPTGATVLSVDSPTQVTLSANATGSQVGANLVFAPWGVGDGSTTFTLPDTRRRTTVGVGGSSTATLKNYLGSLGGAETHTLTVPEIPSHTHSGYVTPGANAATGGPTYYAMQPSLGATGATGGGGSHNNMQPSMVVQKIIKY